MPVTVGKAQVMAVLNACKEAVAAQYAQRARNMVMQTGQRPALAARALCEQLNDVRCVLLCLLGSFDKLCCRSGVRDAFSGGGQGVIRGPCCCNFSRRRVSYRNCRRPSAIVMILADAQIRLMIQVKLQL